MSFIFFIIIKTFNIHVHHMNHMFYIQTNKLDIHINILIPHPLHFSMLKTFVKKLCGVDTW